MQLLSSLSSIRVVSILSFKFGVCTAMPNTENPQFSFQLELECPYCSKQVDFVVREIFDWHPQSASDLNQFRDVVSRTAPSTTRENILMNKSPTHLQTDRKDLTYGYCSGSCPKCRSPIILTISTSANDMKILQNANNQSPLIKGLWANKYMTVVGTLPNKPTFGAPKGVPDVVAELWPATLQSLQRGDPPSRIVTECRSILDVCLKALGAPSKKSRKQQIHYLKEQHILTNGLAEWGEKLWDDGNEAVHEIKADVESAKSHVEYLKLFFRTAFELPAEIERRDNTDS